MKVDTICEPCWLWVGGDVLGFYEIKFKRNKRGKWFIILEHTNIVGVIAAYASKRQHNSLEFLCAPRAPRAGYVAPPFVHLDSIDLASTDEFNFLRCIIIIITYGV